MRFAAAVAAAAAAAAVAAPRAPCIALLSSTRRHRDDIRRLAATAVLIARRYLPKGNTAPHLRIAELWARANAGAADAGRALLGARYVAVRSEDTAHDEDAFLRAGAAVASALDPGRAPEERYALCCMLRNHFAASSAAPGWRKAMESYGKWRGAVASAELGGERGAFARELVGRMRPALERFGYLGAHGGIGALNLSAAAGALHRECAATVVDARCREFQPNKQKCIG